MIQVDSPQPTLGNSYYIRDSAKTLRNLLAEDDLLRATFLDSPYRHPTIQHPLIKTPPNKPASKLPPRTKKRNRHQQSQSINWNKVDQKQCRLSYNPLTKQSKIIPNPVTLVSPPPKRPTSAPIPIIKSTIDSPSPSSHKSKFWHRLSQIVHPSDSKSPSSHHTTLNINSPNSFKPWLTRLFHFK